MIRISLLALALVMGAGQAFAATSADVDSDANAKMECAFVAEFGGYRCVQPVEQASLSEPVDGGAKKKLKFVQLLPPQFNFPFP